ncbi:MAG: hypothetical protein P9X24_19140 [Candidatus Hatepunaea meridiana]|nr:hypothetical protein [Candidatus Hatepunaea meridiana]
MDNKTEPAAKNNREKNKSVKITTDSEGIKVNIISKTSFGELLKSWAPIIVSIMALYSTIIQLQKIREHQRISVTPKLSFYLQDSRYLEKFGLRIENHGLGPAIIDSVIMYVDEDKIDTNDPSIYWNLVLEKLIENKVSVDLDSYKKIYKEWYVPGYALQANAEAIFFGVPEAFTMQVEEDKDGIQVSKICDTTAEVLKHLDMAIYYSSFFGDTDFVLFEKKYIQYDF